MKTFQVYKVGVDGLLELADTKLYSVTEATNHCNELKKQFPRVTFVASDHEIDTWEQVNGKWVRVA